MDTTTTAPVFPLVSRDDHEIILFSANGETIHRWLLQRSNFPSSRDLQREVDYIRQNYRFVRMTVDGREVAPPVVSVEFAYATSRDNTYEIVTTTVGDVMSGRELIADIYEPTYFNSDLPVPIGTMVTATVYADAVPMFRQTATTRLRPSSYVVVHNGTIVHSSSSPRESEAHYFNLVEFSAQDGDSVSLVSSDKYARSSTVSTKVRRPVEFSDTLTNQLRRWAGHGDRVADFLASCRHRTSVKYLSFVDFDYDSDGKPTGLLSFTPKSEYANKWASLKRQTQRPGRLVTRIIDEHDRKDWALTDADIERFANNVKGWVPPQHNEIRLVSGRDIAFWYHGDRYSTSENIGSLEHSCMRYPECNGYFGIYVNNPDSVQLAILTNQDDELVGRALVWQTNRGTAMDRIYGADDTISRFTNYARDQGWHLPYITRESFTVKLKSCEFHSYPYMDSFTYLDTRRGILSTSYDGADRCLQDTGGGYELLGTNECIACGDTISDDQSYWSNNDDGPYCEYCYRDSFTSCQHCGRDIPNDDAISTVDGDTCARCVERYYVTCDDCGDLVRERSCYHDADGNGWYCVSCTEAQEQEVALAASEEN